MESKEHILKDMSQRSLSLMDVEEDEQDFTAQTSKQIKFKQKLVVPTGTWLEKKKAEKLLIERLDLIREKRVMKSDAVSQGDWLDSEQLVKVTRKRGSYWNHIGHLVDKDTFLHPEEAMYMMEINCLNVDYHAVPVSIQQAFTLFLSKSQIRLKDYRVYAHLNRLGFKVIRHKFQCFSKRLGVNKDLIIKSVQTENEKKSFDCNGTMFTGDVIDAFDSEIFSFSEERVGSSTDSRSDTKRALILKTTNSSITTIDISSESTTTDTSVEAISREKTVNDMDDNVNADLVTEILAPALDDISDTPSSYQGPVIDITSEEDDVISEPIGDTDTPTNLSEKKRKRKSLYNPFSNQYKMMKQNSDQQNSLFDILPDLIGKDEAIVAPPWSHLVPKNINLLKKGYRVILKRQTVNEIPKDKKTGNENISQQQNSQINKKKKRKRNRRRNPNIISKQSNNRPQQPQRWQNNSNHNQLQPEWNHSNQNLGQLFLNVLKGMQEINSFMQAPPQQRNNLNIPYGPKPWQRNNLAALYTFYKQKRMLLAREQRNPSNGDVIQIDCDDSEEDASPNQPQIDDPITLSDSDSDCVIEEPNYELRNLESSFEQTNDSDCTEPQPSTSGYIKPSPKYAELKNIYGYWLPPENDFGMPNISSNKGCAIEISLEERSKLLRLFMKQEGKKYSKWSELMESFDKVLEDVPPESSKQDESDEIEVTSIKLGDVKPLRVMKDVPYNQTDLGELSIVKESAVVTHDEWSMSRIVFNVYKLSDIGFKKNEMTPDFRIFSLDMNEDLVSIPDDLLEEEVTVFQVKVGTSSFTYFNTQGDVTSLEDFESDSEDSD